MTEKPINLRDWQARGVLAGTITQHRVVLKPLKRDETSNNPYVMWPVYERGRRCGSSANPDRASAYMPGQILRVRETWGLGLSDHGDCPRYKATMDYQCGDKIKSLHEGPFIWRSPVTMPRRFSRITLRVTAVRVERVQEISEEDAVASGIYYEAPSVDDLEWYRAYCEERGETVEQAGPMPGVWRAPGVKKTFPSPDPNPDDAGPTAQFAYRLLWDSLHGKGAWDRNDWVAALSFERVTT